MKKVIKVLLIILACIAALIVIAVSAVLIAYNHRSDPADVLSYDTTNPHISDRTYISAHRSGAGIMPEETMMAFRGCVEAEDFDVDYFEFDLHITKDEKLVLLHDAELDRTSNSEQVFGRTGARPEEYSLDELRRLNMGAKFVDEAGNMPYSQLSGDDVPDELRIVELGEILDYLESQGNFRYIIEIKNGGELGMKGVDILYEALSERNMVDRVVFGSFQAEVSDYKDKTYPDLMRGAYAKEVIDFYIAAVMNEKDYQPKFGVLQLPYGNTKEDEYLNLGTATVINYAHAHDLAVQYWTINNEPDTEYLMSIKADCIMSDYPDMAYRVRGNM